MKIGCVQNFKARFSPESHAYLAYVKNQAKQSGRMDEYNNAKKIIAFNFPQGIITKEKLYRDNDVFLFNPNQSVQYIIKNNRSKTAELDSFIKLASEIKNISL